MMRLLFGVGLVTGLSMLLLSDPQTASAQKGGGNGTIKKVDAKSGAITINMMVVEKKKKELADREYLLSDDAKVTIVEGGTRKTMTGKEALAAGSLKEGANASFVAENNLKIKELTVGETSKKK